jgi:NAD(P)-dependent dehydrogenase (short-subunit alcohol dehydrogenase family)
MPDWLRHLLLAPPRLRDITLLHKQLSGKTVLITGASYGIGEATARLFAQADASLILLARTEAKLEQLRSELAPAPVSYYAADLANVEAIPELMTRVTGDHPTINIVICNAGKSIRRSVLESAERHDLERQLALNFRSPAAMVLALLPRLIAQGGGRIIHVSSLSSRLPSAPRWGGYHSSKAGFDIWLRALGNELRSTNIRTTSVYLPLVRTRMITPTKHYDRLPALSPLEAAQVLAYAALHPRAQLAPWWLAPAEALAALLATPIHRLLSSWERRA